MNRIITFLVILMSITAVAQAPTSRISYQAVVRNAANVALANTNVGLEITISKNSGTGPSVYSETQNTTTNINGIISIVIGNAMGFDTIDWTAGPYFITLGVDTSGGTNYVLSSVNQLLSVPYALHSLTADVAETADYASLTNTPVIITAEQSTKIDFITVTASVDVDQLQTDVIANTAKVSFPGFGTVPGTALEGDNVIWTKTTDDIFYNQGSVGIGVNETSSFGGATLHVAGPVLFDGVPATTVPGSLYYDNTGNGSFHYIDNTNTDVTLNAGGVTYSSGLWTTENGDATISTDVVMRVNLGIGNDASAGMDFGFNSIIIKENNTRILFDDSDDPAGTQPANDWQIEANQSANGGTSHFAILDVTAGTTPFKIMADAPDHSLFIAENGNIGMGTNSPGNTLEVVGSIKATSFIGDGSGITGLTTGTGGLSNIDDTLIAADSNGDGTGEIAFQTQNTTRMTITNAGAVGIGTVAPVVALEVIGAVKANTMTLSGKANVQLLLISPSIETSATAFSTIYDVTNKSFITLNGDVVSTIQAFTGGVTGQEVTITALTSDITIAHNAATASQNFQLPGNTSIVLTANSTARFMYDGTNWYCTGLNN